MPDSATLPSYDVEFTALIYRTVVSVVAADPEAARVEFWRTYPGADRITAVVPAGTHLLPDDFPARLAAARARPDGGAQPDDADPAARVVQPSAREAALEGLCINYEENEPYREPIRAAPGFVDYNRGRPGYRPVDDPDAARDAAFDRTIDCGPGRGEPPEDEHD